MKQVKSVSLLVLAMVLAVGFASCSDDEEVLQWNELPGTWECISEKGYVYFKDYPERCNEWNNENPRLLGTIAVFRSDGTVKFNASESEWILKDNLLTLIHPHLGSPLEIAYTVLKLSSDKLILEEFNTGGEDDYTWRYWNNLTFQKVK
ncbi:hypothetical protein [Bacteroides reticulotermitis]|uniref:Lipocalin-like domain-containing protein n=2 Tax=Bacteroides reticulotermitis TaxID=1133319 RepID=W4UPB1_9BACE|nr:hypothetical protein [Bacteroides reticulotermitis]MBB4044001.1 hypothetical protein [Bacteroides reticulotermitis]GAE82662.1 hypothetical protein JCM10512_884 [Bacteroides reticulotermitis JCM 10512]HJD75563.1 hypothetical protein [Bacteroides reticulotermitis]